MEALANYATIFLSHLRSILFWDLHAKKIWLAIAITPLFCGLSAEKVFAQKWVDFTMTFAYSIFNQIRVASYSP